MVEDLSTDDELAFRLDGRVSMDDLRDLFDLSDDDEPDEDAYDTVGGFVVHRVGRIPLPGAEMPFRDEVRIVVEAAEPRRVATVVASRPRPPEERRVRGTIRERESTPAASRATRRSPMPRASVDRARARPRAGHGSSRRAASARSR